MSAFLLALIIIVGAAILGGALTWVAFNVNLVKNDPERPDVRRPLMNGKEDYPFWLDFNNNRKNFNSDREWRLDYEAKNPHPYNEKVGNR